MWEIFWGAGRKQRFSTTAHRNYGGSTMAAMARIPERWVWVLDLQQQFPAIGREWFLHDPARPERIVFGFCPECFYEQIARRRFLHLKAEWASGPGDPLFPTPTAVVLLLSLVRAGPDPSISG